MLLFGSVRKACAAVSEVKLSQTCLCGSMPVVPLARWLRVARALLMRGEQRIPKGRGFGSP